MKITQGSIALGAEHHSAQRQSVRVSLQSAPQGSENEDTLHLSDIAQRLAAQTTAQPSQIDETTSDLDPRISLIKQMVELITGKPIRVYTAQTPAPDASASLAQHENRPAAPSASPPPPSINVAAQGHYEESETLNFSAGGEILTSDGRSIAFRLDLSLNRHFSVDIGLTAGQNTRKTDPLVLNFAGTSTQLSEQRIQFDLNGDGQTENMPGLASGSAYLALDRNGNGQIDDGTELFGPGSASGYAALAAYDSDGNGWIDEADPIFQQLKMWRPENQGNERLTSLRQADVGALYLGHIASPFALRGERNEDLGTLTASGLYLTESGRVGTMQEIDLSV